jgi:cytochrome c-type biogenesis protein CcmH
MKILIVLSTLWLFMSPAQAAIEALQFKDQATEAEYKNLIKELRCLVCQNQNLADSDADLAKDLRQQTYEMLMQGKNKEQIVEYMVNRYGDFVLYNPPLKSNTLLLWGGPFALLLLVLIIVILRVRKSDPVEAPEADAMEQAKSLLSDQQEKNKEQSK